MLVVWDLDVRIIWKFLVEKKAISHADVSPLPHGKSALPAKIETCSFYVRITPLKMLRKTATSMATWRATNNQSFMSSPGS